MFAAIALFASASALPANPYDEAITCGRAAVENFRAEENFLQNTSDMGYFSMLAAKRDPQGKPILQRMTETPEEIVGARIAGDSASVMQECDKKYPLARSRQPVKLPQDRLTADVLCMGIFALQIGVLEGGKDDAEGQVLNDLLQPYYESYMNRVSNERLAARGITSSEQFDEWFAQQIGASMQIGNLWMLQLACMRADQS